MNWQEINYWNKNSYGNAFRVKRSTLITLAVVTCIATPCTNFLIPILPKIIKQDWRIRY